MTNTSDIKEMYATLSAEQQSMLFGIAVMLTELTRATYFANEKNKQAERQPEQEQRRRGTDAGSR